MKTFSYSFIVKINSSSFFLNPETHYFLPNLALFYFMAGQKGGENK